MRKISSYLYPNRVQLLADVAGSIPTEYTNVYQRTVKIYKGVDNVIEFDIKNADQKRLELNTSPDITDIMLNIMDSSGNALPSSPYTVTPGSIKGIATAVIPSADLEDLAHQFFRYSVTATKGSNTIPLYADSRFGVVGTIELVGDAMPTTRGEKIYDRFSGEVDFAGNVKNHTSVVPCKFYEAVPTTTLNFDVTLNNYKGKVLLEATKDSTISVESFSRNGVELASRTLTSETTEVISFSNIAVEDYNFMRITWVYLDPTLIGVYNNGLPTGTVDKVVVY